MPTKEKVLKDLNYNQVKALAREFQIPLEKETWRGTKKVTKSSEMIDLILQYRHPTKDEILDFFEDYKIVMEAKKKLRKMVKCTNCKSTNIEQRGTTPESEMGWEGGLGSILRGRRKKIKQMAIYFCKDCGETFQRPIKAVEEKN